MKQFYNSKEVHATFRLKMPFNDLWPLQMQGCHVKCLFNYTASPSLTQDVTHVTKLGSSKKG